jgi:hypothetical protein
MARWFRFLLAILVGLLLGALYGWLVNPVEYVDTAPDSLRVDYKADYVLMVAESFHADGNLPLAEQRLAALGKNPPAEIVRKALLSAEPHYSDADVALIRSLRDALQGGNPAQEGQAP